MAHNIGGAAKHLRKLIAAERATLEACTTCRPCRTKIRAYELAIAALTGEATARATDAVPRKVAAAIAVRAAAAPPPGAGLKPRSDAYMAALTDTVRAFLADGAPHSARDVLAHVHARGFAIGLSALGAYRRRVGATFKALGHGRGTEWVLPTNGRPATRKSKPTPRPAAPPNPGDPSTLQPRTRAYAHAIRAAMRAYATTAPRTMAELQSHVLGLGFRPVNGSTWTKIANDAGLRASGGGGRHMPTPTWTVADAGA